jgi:ABC-type polysaccharide/polyol phosphate export permease
VNSLVYTNAHQGQVRRLIPDLIRSRQLLFDLVWKDIRIRYRYALMGFLWAVLEPLIMMAVLTVVFVFVFDLRPTTGGGATDAAVKILCGLIAWQFFSNAVSAATNSLVDNRSLVTKVNFPREVIPLSSIGIAVVNLVIGSVLILLLYSIMLTELPSVNIVFIPLVFIIQFLLIIGLALFLSSWNARFRDVGYMVNACLLFGFYATPVIYEAQFIVGKLEGMDFPGLKQLFFLNPMAGIITAYRNLLFGVESSAVDWLKLLAWPAACALLLLVLGVVTFRRQAPTLSDRL